MPESLLQVSNILLFGVVVDDLDVIGPPEEADEDAEKPKKGKKLPQRKGNNNQLGDQLTSDSNFARIYAFSYEGAYYELPWPALFLVHGDGDPVTPATAGVTNPGKNASRAPTDPSRTGLTAADFQFSDDVKFWTYDKADYTVRLDVETGMFEQVLLDVIFDGGPGGIAGANVRGANVRGANVRGANVRGANVRGANVRGANVRGGGGGD